MPKPSSVWQPRCRASRINRVSGGLKITSATTMSGSSVSTASGTRASASPRPIDVALITTSRLGRDLVVAFPLHEAGRHVNFVVDQRGQLLAARFAPIDDGDLRRAGQADFDRDRPGRAAGAQDDHVSAGRIGHFAQRLHETLAVGVVADQLVAHAIARS